MIGTEKQVKWAEDIVEEFRGRIAHLRDEYVAAAERAGRLDDPLVQRMLAETDRLVEEHIAEHQDAAYWISLKKDDPGFMALRKEINAEAALIAQQG